MPCFVEPEWRGLLEEAASRAGIPVARYPDMWCNLPEAGIVLTADPVPAPDGWDEICLVASPSLGAAFLTALGFNRTDSVRRVATFLAYASDAQTRGATIIDSQNVVMSVAGLGELRRSLPNFDANDDIQSLDIYRSLPVTTGARASWATSLFAYGSYGSALALETDPLVDITGRARILVFGPQIALPPGKWKLKVVFLCDPDIGTTCLQMSWGYGHDRQELWADIDARGEYVVEMTHEWSKVAESEFIIMSAQPHFSGAIKIVSIEVERL